MNTYKVTFLTGYCGGRGYDTEITKEFKCKSFEDAFYTAKKYEWHADVCAKIIGIEEVQKDY